MKADKSKQVLTVGMTVFAVAVSFFPAAMPALATDMKTPETSKYFERHEDPSSHVVSWILKPGLTAHNQQSLYFTAKSMTDDGRFFLYHAACDEFDRKRPRRGKWMMMIDFRTDELIELEGVRGDIPFLDVSTDRMWYLKDDGICRRDLLVDPKKEIRVCELDPSVVMKKGEHGHLATHLTLTADRRRAFLDWCVARGTNIFAEVEAHQYVIDLATGKAEKWGDADFWMNHGQLHPTDPSLAMCAYENCSQKWVTDKTGKRVKVPRPGDEVYPRLILVEKGKRTFVPSLIVNYATHEHWSEDGKGFYWCASGVHWRDLVTGAQRTVCPLPSAHATLTADNRYVTSDCSWGGWWRGCGWTTTFWNRDTHQGVYIHTKTPVYASREKPSGLHPDPHPQFVCNDRYVVCTMNVKEHQMTVAVTPVSGLVRATSRPLPPPVRMPLEWNARRDVTTPFEVEIRWKKLRDAGLVAKLEPERPLGLFPGSFGVEATLKDGSRRRLDVTPLAGRTQETVVLRFRVPEGTAALELLSGVGGRFELVDTEHCDNLFAGALVAPEKWTVTNGGRAAAGRCGVLLTAEKVGENARAEYAVDVPEGLAGRPCRFEADVRSLSDMTWGGPIVIRQLDAQGRELPEFLVDPRWTGHMRPPQKTAQYREEGFIHRNARKLVFSAQLRYIRSATDNHGLPLDRPDRLQPKLLVTRLAVRPAETLPFPGYDGRHFAPGVSGDPADFAIRLGGENVFCYQTRSQASWARNVPMRRDDQIYFPRLAGTVEAWFRPDWKADDATRYSLVEAVHSAAHVEGAYHAATRGPLVEISYVPKTGRARLRLKDFTNRVFKAEGPAVIPSGAWTHVACTFAPDGEAVLWVGGKRTLATPLKGFVPFDLEKTKYPNDAGPVEVWLGGSYVSGRVSGSVNRQCPFVPGSADLLRVSCGERYRADFAPATAFSPDADTCALFGFDRTFDGWSAHGPGRIDGSYRSLAGREDRFLVADGKKVRYWPDEPLAANDFRKVLDDHCYKTLPGTAEARLARRNVTRTWTLKAGETAELDCGKGVVTDFVEYRNRGSRPVVHPLVVNRGEIDPRSFGDIGDTLLANCRTDRDRANRLFNFVMKASNYSQSHHPTFHPGSDVPKMVEYEALMMLNAYCGFECGPLNNLAANLFACSGGCPSSQTQGYGHSFEEVFYDGKNRIYDLSARKFFPAMDNESVACLSDADREFGVIARWGGRVGGFCRNGGRSHATQNPAYQEKCAVTLNPGEGFRVWRMNDGLCNDLQLNSCWPGNHRTIKRPVCFYKTDAEKATRAHCRTNSWVYGIKDDDLGRVDRFFPDYANGFLTFDGRPTADNPAFGSVEKDGFVYRVKSPYPIVHAEYRAETASGAAALELSTDGGKTWFPLAADAAGRAVVDYPVRARLAYLVRVRAPIAEVTRLTAVTEVQVNRRILPGELRPGKNALTLRADCGEPVEVTVGYREKAKDIAIEGALLTGAIVGNERLFALVDVARPLALDVRGASDAAKVRCHGGVEATLEKGKLTVCAGTGDVPRLAAVDVVDGEAEIELTVLVAKDARLVSADAAKLAGGAKLLKRDGGRANATAMLAKAGETARFEFAPLPKGEYVVLNLTRYQSRLSALGGSYGAFANRDLAVKLPGLKEPVGAGAQESLPDGYWKTPMGLERPGERGNFKWEYAVDPHSYYPYQMMRSFALPEGASFAEFSMPEAFPGGVEVAAVLVLPVPSRDFKAFLRKVLCGYNCEPWRVTSGVSADVSVRQTFRPERLSAGATNIRPLQPVDGAAWIWMENEVLWGEDAMAADAWENKVPPPASRFYRFRREFTSDGSPLTVDVSADERFVLLLDGRPVARGPHRGLVSHWYYQTYEIAGLASGPHVLEAVCWQLGNHAPLAQLSWRGGFVLKASGVYDAQLTTGKAAWRVGRLRNTRMTDRGTSQTYGAGSQCEIDGTSFVDEVPARWEPAAVVRPAIVRNPYGGRRNGWMLFPTERPDQLHATKTPGRVMNAATDLTKPFTVAAGEKLDLWWDLGDYYSGYPELSVSGGKGATVRWGWTESLRDGKGQKGDRNEWRGKAFSQTFTDTFRPDGRNDAFFTTPWWRCGRWCRLELEAADEPLTVTRVALAESRYPLSVDFSFESDDPSLGAIVSICRRAVENCAHEMLFDCPYYEQQMYPGDTRIQLQVLNALTRDDRMARFALSVFDYDRRANGMVAMNFPTRGTQECPTYTLCWILMFRDYLMWHGDAAFLKARMPGVRNALMNFALYEDADGLLRDLPGWNYMDWVKGWNSKVESGVAPGCHEGETPGSLNSLLYLNALKAAADVEDALGERHFAVQWREKADRLGASLVRLFWDDGRGAVADVRTKDAFSEHAQCLAILGGILSPEQEDRALATLVNAKDLAVASSYFAYYLFETFATKGRADLILKRFDFWRHFLELGAKTTFETQFSWCRSDCHAWSACPVYFLSTTVAGVRPAEPFFRSVRVAPDPAGLKRVVATTPCPQGLVRTDLAFAGGRASGTVTLPANLTGEFVWRGKRQTLVSGENRVSID